MLQIFVKMVMEIVLLTACVATGFAEDDMAKNNPQESTLKKATFAGGCFWCMEKPYEQYEGIQSAISGYAGGRTEDPTYEEVSSGTTGHLEAVQVTYDPSRITYEELLDIFWRQIDPTDDGGQFADRGEQYTTAIFYHDERQKVGAEKSKKELGASGKFSLPIATKIIPYTKFYPAEDYHQDYYKKNSVHYNSYFHFSGRGPYQKKVWDKK